VRAWLETLDAAPDLPVLAFAAGLGVDPGADAPGSIRRAVLLLAAGGDPHRGLDLDGRAVTALAAELDEPARREAFASGLAALAGAAAGLPAAPVVMRLLADPELAWRAYAAGLLADSLEDDE
jgi:hypothetical protein